MTDRFLLTRRYLLAGGGAFLLSPSGLGISSAFAATDVTIQINRLRKNYGVPPLQPDERLDKAALYQAKLMAEYGKIGHNIGWSNTFTARLKQAGIRGPAAENVASGQKDVASVLDAWLKSAGHRRNLLDPLFTRFGLAYAFREDKPHYLYWAMLYGV
ncbi:CAP domain-containing protein [Pseudochrobactrum sp. HB0163]|uniref:CAP domain-containing protein n=1 Tax=Pseudochrobactrum sp. HB0163 TaxID=3450708 RepID=UPI003F6E3855